MGCSPHPTPALGASDGGSSASLASTGGLTSAPVDPALVAAYVRYQHALNALGPAMDSTHPLGPAAPAGHGGATWETVRAAARDEERALATAGLTEDGLETVEPMVLTVLVKLRVLRASNWDQTLAAYERIRGRVPPQNQAELEPIVAGLKARQAESGAFEAERARFGAPGVDAVLAHGKELLEAQDRWLQRQERQGRRR